ncbi:MAG TPA: beta-galactosidase trimerization domain-containing protein [Armatimonadota bacterium]|nr:beta-galactosidase trimerization domain-containing protein [Armatimonadota bacterium]
MKDLWAVAFWMDLLRPLKDRPFWNTETATCWNGSTAANGYKEPGFCRVNSWLPIALGGEANLYWLWRAHWSGQELMHGSVVSSCGRPLHMIGEVQEIAAGFRKAEDFLNNTKPTPSGLGLHFSGNVWWLFKFQPMVNGFDYNQKILHTAYRPLMQMQLRPDVIDPAQSLEQYRLIFSPYLPALDEGRLRERIYRWIEDGGTWVVGPLSDNRTLDATKYTQSPFGSLEEWAGVYCKYEIPGDPRDFAVQWPDGHEEPGSVWYAGFEPRGAEVLATYNEGELAGLAAVTRKAIGKGQIIVLGTMPRPEALQQLLWEIGRGAGVTPVAKATPNLLVVPREGAAGKGIVAVELENQPASISLSKPMTDILTGQRYAAGTVDLPAYSVTVFKEDE